MYAIAHGGCTDTVRKFYLQSTDGIYPHTKLDGKPFILSRLKAKTKVLEALIRDTLFADAVTLASPF